MGISRFIAVGLLSFALTGAAAAADDYPNRPVRIINPFPAGGGLDVLIRPIAQKLTESFGQTFIVENRPGANGMIGTQAVAKATADGYTLLAGTPGALAMNAAVNPNLPYDPVKDFAPVSNFADSAYIITVHPSLPVKTLQEFVALAKEKPDTITFGSSGLGSAQHFAAEQFSLATGIKLSHVPYKGSAPANNDLVAGHIMAMFDSLQSQTPMIRAGTVRPLGLLGPARSSALPDVPTVTEAGLPEVNAGSWYGLLAPTGTPRAIVERLSAEVRKAILADDMKGRLDAVGTQAVGNSPDEFADQIKSDVKKYRELSEQMNIRQGQ